MDDTFAKVMVEKAKTYEKYHRFVDVNKGKQMSKRKADICLLTSYAYLLFK